MVFKTVFRRGLEKEKISHICDRCYSAFDSLLRSIKSKDKRNICEKCYKTVHSTLNQLHLEEKLYVCNICSMKFDSEEFLKGHRKVCGHTCTTCNQIFILKTDYDDHMAMHSAELLCVCNTCYMGFNSKNDLREHSLTCRARELLCVCNTCYIGFNSKDDLREHSLTCRARESVKKQFACEICHVVFEEEKAMLDHKSAQHKDEYIQLETELEEKVEEGVSGDDSRQILSHEHNKPYVCEICLLAFAHLKMYAAHVKKHEGGKTYQCDICDESYLWQIDLTQHLMKKHATPKQLQCNHCRKKFYFRNGFEDHIKTHIIQRKNQCAECDKAFTWKFDLDSHACIRHKYGKMYQCKLCDESFSWQMEMIQHLMKSHATRKQNRCDRCYKRFTSIQILTQHMESHYSKMPYQCSKCDKAFMVETDLDNHTPTHAEDKVNSSKPHVCHLCYLVYDNEPELIRHNTIQHKSEQTAQRRKTYLCDKCCLVFDNERNLAQHNHETVDANATTDKAYQCSLCDRSFASVSVLRQHVAKVHLSKEQAYRCTLCDTSFVHGRDLKHHVSIYHRNKGKIYHCSFCVRSFVRQRHLKIHETKVHLNKEHYSGRRFKTSNVEDMVVENESREESMAEDIEHSLKQEENVKGDKTQQLLNHQQEKDEIVGKDFRYSAKREHQDDNESQMNEQNEFPHFNQTEIGFESGNVFVKSEPQDDKVNTHIEHNRKPIEMTQDERHTSNSTNNQHGHNDSLDVISSENHPEKHTSMLLNLSGMNQYKCDQCENSFIDSSQLLEHKNQEHTDQKNMLRISSVFSLSEMVQSSFRSIAPHMNIVQNNTLYPKNDQHRCPTCGKLFLGQYQLNAHKASHARNEIFKCNQCDETFKMQSQLSGHMNVHTHRHKCTHCGKSSLTKVQLNQHMQECVLYNSGKCIETFAFESGLKLHKEPIKQYILYRCAQCHKEFNLESALKQHMLIHAGEKHHQCTQCGKFFMEKTNLDRHMLIHRASKVHH